MHNVTRWLVRVGLWAALVLCLFPHVCAWAVVYRDPQGEFSIDLPQDFQGVRFEPPVSKPRRVRYALFRSGKRIVSIELERIDARLPRWSKQVLIDLLEPVLSRQQRQGRLLVEKAVAGEDFSGWHTGLEPLHHPEMASHDYCLLPRRRNDRMATLLFFFPRDGQERMNDAEMAAIVQSFRFGDASGSGAQDASEPAVDWRLALGVLAAIWLLAFLLRSGYCLVTAGLVCRQWSFRAAAKTVLMTDLSLCGILLVVIGGVVFGVIPAMIALKMVLVVGFLWLPIYWLHRCYAVGWGRAVGTFAVQQVIGLLLALLGVLLLPSTAQTYLTSQVAARRQLAPSKVQQGAEAYLTSQVAAQRQKLASPWQRASGPVSGAPSLPPAASAPVAAPQPAATEWRLGGISRARGQTMVLINDKALSVGDQINGYTVAAIAGSRVTLTSADETITLDIK